MEAVEKMVRRSFLCLGFVVSQSVMLVERLFVSRSVGVMDSARDFDLLGESVP